jgi:hypothetical protein
LPAGIETSSQLDQDLAAHYRRLTVMAWWMTVYCRKSVAQLDAQQLLDGLRDRDPEASAGVDYALLAEVHELDEDDADEALEHLEVVTTGPRPLDVEIRYRSNPDARPIVVHLWDAPERVAEELEETLEGREPPEGALPYLSACREVIGIELGFGQLEDMGIVFASELARYLAQKGDGVIVDDENQWFAVADGGFVDP